MDSIRGGKEKDGGHMFFMMDAFMKVSGKMILCQAMEGLLRKIAIMKDKLKKEELMEQEIMKINLECMQVNGKMTKGMEWEKRYLRIKRKSILESSRTINMMEKEN